MELKPCETELSNDSVIVQPYPRGIRIGVAYQATIPELQCGNDGPLDDRDLVLQDCNRLSDAEIEEYIQKLHCPFYILCLSKCKANEDSICVPIQNGFTAEKVVWQKRKLSPLNVWSEDECIAFESGMNTYWKKFHMIQSQFCKSRTVGELVRFYYFWKRTNRFTAFCKKYKKNKLSISSKMANLKNMDKENTPNSRPFTRYLKKRKIEELFNNLKQFNFSFSDLMCSSTIDKTDITIDSNETSTSKNKTFQAHILKVSACSIDKPVNLNESTIDVKLESIHNTRFQANKHASAEFKCTYNTKFKESEGDDIMKSKQRKLISC